MKELEIWKPIPGYETAYLASNLGRVKSLDRIVTKKRKGLISSWRLKGKILRPIRGGNGYLTVHLYGKTKTVHALVMLTFVGTRPINKNEIAHQNGIKTDNNISNLRYVTYSENNLDKIDHGKMPRGEKHHACKLTKIKINQIRSLHKRGISQTLLSKKFKINSSHISNIINNKAWAHV